MAMSIAHRKTLDKTLEVLTEDMDVIPAIIHLKSKDILRDLDEEKINAKNTEKEKVMELVKIIKKRGKKVYPTLIDYFQNCRGSEHLAEELDYNLKAVEEKLQGLQVERDGRRQIDIWNKYEEKFHYIRCKHDSIGQYNQLPDKINILLIGKTGSGKSATGNTILGKSHFKSTSYSFSETKTIDLQDVREDRFTITVIDTPGLFDTAKEFRNEDLLLEIAKTMITFNGGVHLFLLVCNGTVRFTKEEQDAIDVIERILSKSVYNNCVVVLTNAYAQFGTKGKLSVRELAKCELDQGGNFADLLNRVNRRMIAVENCFEDEFLSEKHRQRLLCYLAEVIHDNNGSKFSNTAFENAKKKVEHQDTERKKRITREKELTQMRKELRNFLLYEYFSKLPENELNDITGLFKKDLSYIRFHSGVQQLECVSKEDVKTYLESFMRENEPLIQKLKDVRIQQLRQQREYEERRRELLKKEGINKMQSIVLPLIGNRLRQMSAQQLEEIEKVEQLPDNVMKEVMECVKCCKMAVEPRDITQFIKETFFENPTQIKRYKDEKIIQESLAEKAKQLKIVEREQKLNTVMESLKSRLPVALDQKSDEELQELMSDLEDESSSHQETWQPLFEELVDDEVTNSDLSSSELCESYLKKNYKFLQSVVVTTVEKRKKHKEATLKLQRERLRNSAYGRISERIEENLRSYLVGKNVKNIQDLNDKIKIGEVPPEIIEEVSECLTEAEKLALSEVEIKLEVLNQIKEQNELIEKCKKEAECFPGSSMVRCKERGNCSITNIKVDDEILVYDQNGNCYYDKVYLISHGNKTETSIFVSLQTSSGKQLSMSPGHLLPVGRLRSNVAAKNISVGDIIFTLQNGTVKPDTVVSVSCQLLQGLYCPMTMNGSIVVNDVAASCYTTFIPSRLAHVLLFPIRVLFNYLPLSLFDKLLPYDEEEEMPVLLLKCRAMVTTWRFSVNKLLQFDKELKRLNAF